MYQLLNKNGEAIGFGLGLLIALVFLGIVFSGLDQYNALSDSDKLNSGIFNFGLFAAIALAIVCTLLIVFFAIFTIVKNPKSSMKGIVESLVLVGIFILGFIFTSPAEAGPMKTIVERFELSNFQEKFIGGGLTSMYILLAIAIGAIALSEIRNFFK